MNQEELSEINNILESFFIQTRIPLYVIDSLDGTINIFSNTKNRTWTRGIFKYVLSKRNSLDIPKNVPFLSSSPHGVFAGIIIFEDLYLGVGPVMSSNITLSDFIRTYSELFSSEDILSIYDIANDAPRENIDYFANTLSLLNKLLNNTFYPHSSIIDLCSESDDYSSEEILSDISNADILPSPNPDSMIEFENSLESTIKTGNTENIDKIWEISEQLFMDTLNTVSNSSYYIFIRLLTIMNRAALTGGADERVVFRATDKYVKQLEIAVSDYEKYSLLKQAAFTYCSIVSTALSRGAFAIHAKKCIRYIEDNLSRKITVNDLSILCDISKRQIFRVFKESFNTSVSEYITDKRLEKALILLKTTSLPISEICLDCGFPNQSYFSKTFKSHFDISPTDFRSNKSKNVT